MAAGKKTGGRSIGVPNKRTEVKQLVEEVLKTAPGREALAAAMHELTKPPPSQKKAVEMLREIAVLSMSMVALHQPKRRDDGTLVVDNEDKLQTYLNIAVRSTAELASFESPKFKAVALTEVPPLPAPGADGNVIAAIRKGTQQEAADMYMRLVRAGAGK